MILNTHTYEERRNNEEPFEFDDAQTVASWWYSPSTPALVIFTQQGRIPNRTKLADEVERELNGIRGTGTTSDMDDLRALLDWVKEER